MKLPPNMRCSSTRPSRSGCNPRVPWAGSLSLGRSGHGNALLAISAASAISAREKRNAQRRRERRGPAVGIEWAMDGEAAPTTHAPNKTAPVNAPVHQDFSYDDAANKTLAGVGDTRVFSSARGSIRWAGQVTPQIRIHHGQWRAAPLPGLGWQGRDYAVSARDWRYGAYF